MRGTASGSPANALTATENTAPNTTIGSMSACRPHRADRMRTENPIAETSAARLPRSAPWPSPSATINQMPIAGDRDGRPCRPGPPGIMIMSMVAPSVRAAMWRQGYKSTSFAWTDRLKRASTRISMDGKEWGLHNIFIERLLRSLKYECVYLHAWDSTTSAPPHRPRRTVARRDLLQHHQSRSAGSGSRLNIPEICPRIGE